MLHDWGRIATELAFLMAECQGVDKEPDIDLVGTICAQYSDLERMQWNQRQHFKAKEERERWALQGKEVHRELCNARDYEPDGYVTQTCALEEADAL